MKNQKNTTTPETVETTATVIDDSAVNAFSLAAPEVTTPAAPVAADVVTMDDDEKMVADLTTRRVSYCSLTAETAEEKTTLYNAMNNPQNRVKDCINETIALKDVFVEVVHCVNRETGESVAAPRVVFIDENGIGFQCVSTGVFSALKKLFAVFGEPKTWEKPVKIKIKQLNRGTDKSILTFDVVG